MYYDAHVHLSHAWLKEIQKYPVSAIVSCQNEEEWKQVQKLQKNYKHIYASYGIHPWMSGETSFQNHEKFLHQAKIIGEIGMDCVWCNVAYQKQELLFVQQLQYAASEKKPVILHTKGYEKEILNWIQQYPNTYLVHWYSHLEYVEEYAKCGCFFSVGPFPNKDKNVYHLVEVVDLHQLLIESDGIDAISWALSQNVHAGDYVFYLQQILKEIAQIKQLNMKEVQQQIANNFNRFLEKAME